VAPDRPKDWRKLCEAAAKEQDPDKLMALIIELNEALEQRGRSRNASLEEELRNPQSSSPYVWDGFVV
jgi:hypothetical protein